MPRLGEKIKPQDPPQDEGLSIGAVARELGISIGTLRNWEAKGKATFTRKGKDRRMSRDELRRLRRVIAQAKAAQDA